MFGTSTPWLTVATRILRTQWSDATYETASWQRTRGVIDMWQEVNVEIPTQSGDWQVLSYQYWSHLFGFYNKSIMICWLHTHLGIISNTI